MAVSALSWINGLPARTAEAELMSCGASPVWAPAVAARRPYRDTVAVTAAGAAALAAAPWLREDAPAAGLAWW
jgi:2-oxo-4-hydroxy-4-carboxy-5-ureidoimidazoline decarboxylase